MTDKSITICGHGSGTPSTKNLNTYSETRYKSVAKNGKHKGIVAVRRPKNMTDALRTKFHDTYKSILGRNLYNQNLRQYVYTPYKGAFYSDCSSSGCATYKKIGLPISLLNTAGIYSSEGFEAVSVTIKDGHITNPSKLKVGDAILFVGDDASRPLQIGHVEYVYEIASDSKSQKTTYFDKYTGTSTSLVTALSAVGATDTSKTYRTKIATANGITGYTGTAAQNTKLLNLLKKGKLVKP